MSDAATPAEQLGVNPPAAPAATPAPAEGTPPVATTPAMVSLTTEAHDQLLRDQARAAANQRKADLYDRKFGKDGRGSGHFTPQAPATPPSQEEKDAVAEQEDRKAERGLLSLALDPNYRALLDSDPTLRDMLTKNPLAVLPIMASDALDAEDAISLVKEELNKRVAALTPATPATPAPATPAADNVPPAGGVNPPGQQTVNADYEAARKIPNTENAIAGMIKARGKK